MVMLCIDISTDETVSMSMPLDLGTALRFQVRKQSAHTNERIKPDIIDNRPDWLYNLNGLSCLVFGQVMPILSESFAVGSPDGPLKTGRRIPWWISTFYN